MTDVFDGSIAGLHVSRETFELLRRYEALVQRWNPTINLVSRNTIPTLWQRHIEDSAQVFAFCPPSAALWLDIGSGGGFPGIVVAVLAKELLPGLRVTLVESDLRKATFLRQASLALQVETKVFSERVESLPPVGADVLSARALAPLSDLLFHAERHLASGGIAIFPKGARFAAEIEEARTHWAFDVDTHPSLSDAEASILVIRNIHRAPD